MRHKSISVLVSSTLVVALGWLCLAGCDRAVGAGDTDAAPPNPDAAPPVDAAVQPDGSTVVTGVLGWHSVAEEHTGFVTADAVDPVYLDDCSPWIFAMDGGETWWTYGTSGEALLPWYPDTEGWMGVGLGLISGELSPPGQYGHMGAYQRELWITGWELQVCPTVDRLRHCVAPRAGDFCQFPEPFANTRRDHLVRVLPGPMALGTQLELSVYYNEGVADGETNIYVALHLPEITDPNPPEWIPIEVSELLHLSVTEERLWAYYELVDYPDAHDGWVLWNPGLDNLRLSLSAESAAGEPIHIWGDFPVDEVIAYP